MEKIDSKFYLEIGDEILQISVYCGERLLKIDRVTGARAYAQKQAFNRECPLVCGDHIHIQEYPRERGYSPTTYTFVTEAIKKGLEAKKKREILTRKISVFFDKKERIPTHQLQTILDILEGGKTCDNCSHFNPRNEKIPTLDESYKCQNCFWHKGLSDWWIKKEGV